MSDSQRRNLMSCLRKVAYPTRAEADGDLANLLRKVPPANHPTYRVYACYLCGSPHYHVGRRPRRAGLPLRARLDRARVRA